MSLRLKFILYLIITHALFGLTAVYLIQQRSLWLFIFEAAFAISLAIGIKLVSNLFGTLELIQTGAEFINDGDFTTRFVEVGQPEMDQLVNIYNRMIDHLREERVRMQEQNFFLEKLMAASPAGILTMDFDHRIAMLNPCAKQLLQLPEAALKGKMLTEIKSQFLNELDQLHLGESKVIALSGRRRIKCQKSQFVDRGFERHFILMEELTEELRQSEKTAYEKLIRLMSHEVNNTVGAASSLLHSCLHYSVQIQAIDRQDFETAINVVIARTNQLGEFMRSFAEVVKLPPPRLQPADVLELLSDLIYLMKADCERRQIKIQWKIDLPLDRIEIDQVLMEQVFINLLKNAVEAIGTDGLILICTGVENSRRFISIEDSGSGLSAEVREHLFTPFFSTKENGQGIGLTLVQEILDAHGFDFSLESEHSQPTRFIIWFD